MTTFNTIDIASVNEAFTPLQRAILEHDIPVLDFDEVRQYQEEKLARERRKLLVKNIGKALGSLALTAAAVYGQYPALHNFRNFLTLLALSSPWPYFLGHCAGNLRALIFDPDQVLGWNTNLLYPPDEERWPGMPDEIARRCALLEQIPGVELTVDWLGPDPFLWAFDGSCDYCVGAWDEEGWQ